MKRASLLLGIVGLTALMMLVVVFGSPYAPVIEPVRDIEEIWAIEDERTPSEEPLVTALELDGAPLAYEAETNTFYCTLGVDQGDAWPQLHITAPDAQDVTLCFTDDYSYDWCADAIAEGYAYEVMAYTDTQYDYLYIVFTGLPVISVQAEAEITGEDTPVYVSMSAWGETALESQARMHVRGASTFAAEKSGYRIEFTRGAGTGNKVEQVVPSFGLEDDLVLLPLNYDDTKMRDRLSWDVYAQLAQEEESFGARQCGYVELWIDGQYEGLYLALEPFNIEEELQKSGNAHVLSDSVYRTSVLNFSHDRIYCEHPHRGNTGFELYYTQADEEYAFAPLEHYLELVDEEDDARFAQKALACMDIDSIVRMELLVQGGGMTDNFYNNLYVWAVAQGEPYRFAPWDMDMTWGLKREEIGQEYENWLTFGVFDRMIELNVGDIRTRLYQAWTSLRETVFSEARIEARLEQYAHELNDSGAMMRNAQRWNLETPYADGFEISTFCSVRFARLDALFARLASAPEESQAFLTTPDYEYKAIAMPQWEEDI